MSKLLYITSSPRGEASESIALAETFLAEYRTQHPDLEVDRLDLWEGSLPVYGGKGAEAKLVAFAGQTPTGEIGEAWAKVQAGSTTAGVRSRSWSTAPPSCGRSGRAPRSTSTTGPRRWRLHVPEPGVWTVRDPA